MGREELEGEVMTIVCSYCKTVKGEKCGVCSSKNVRGLSTTPAVDADIWGCECGHAWFDGTDGETHGICDPPCAEAVKAGVKE